MIVKVVWYLPKSEAAVHLNQKQPFTGFTAVYRKTLIHEYLFY